MSQKIINYVGMDEISNLVDMAMLVNKNRTVKDCHVHIYADYASVHIESDKELTLFVYYRLDEDNIINTIEEKQHFEEYVEVKRILEDLILKGLEDDHKN